MGKNLLLAVFLLLLAYSLPAQSTAKDFLDSGNEKRNAGNYGAAIADYSRAIELNPSLALAYFYRANSFCHVNNFDGAIDDYAKALEIDPSLVGAYVGRASSYLQKGDPDNAIADATKAITLNPAFAEAYRFRGDAYLRKANFVNALPDLDRNIELGNTTASAYLSRAVAREGISDFSGAIVDETKAIELDPKLIPAYKNRAISRRSYGDYVGAIADYNRVLDSDPSDRYMIVGRTWTKFFMHDYEGAGQDAALFFKMNGGAVEGEGPFIVIVNYLSLRKSGKTSEAKVFLESSIKNAKKGEWPTQLLQLLAGQVTAEELLKQATDDGRRTEVHSLAGEAFFLAGDSKNAAAHFQWNKENGNRTRILFQLSRLEYAAL